MPDMTTEKKGAPGQRGAPQQPLGPSDTTIGDAAQGKTWPWHGVHEVRPHLRPEPLYPASYLDSCVKGAAELGKTPTEYWDEVLPTVVYVRCDVTRTFYECLTSIDGAYGLP